MALYASADDVHDRTDWARLRPYLPASLYQELLSAGPDAKAALCLEHLNDLIRAVVTYVPRHVVLKLLQTPAIAQNSGEFLKGTLLFSDISGFTALSERLRRSGDAEGAEAIVKVINDYLDVMLAIVFKYNGLLIKFGGDAMLCLFTGEDYGALRAVIAAWEMKQTMLTRFSEIQALNETVELGMKVGSNSGLLLAANVGTVEHMEYILTGGVVEHTAHAESWATRGDILISRESYTLVKDYLEVERRATGQLLAHEPGEMVFFKVVGVRAGAALELPDTWQTVENLLAQVANDPWGIMARLDALTPYLPAGVLAQLVYDPQHGAIEGQHRQVTVLFINFVGMRDIISAHSTDAPEAVTAQLSEYFCAMQEEVRYYGGMINKVDLYDQGDKLMVIFGAPVAHEKDAQRAALTALAMQKALDNLACSGFLSQRIGINSGYVFAGNVGSAVCHRREYTVMGDDVNVAARLMSAAAPGQILLSQSVWAQIQSNFTAAPLAAIQVKGKTDPIPIFQLQAVLDTPAHRPDRALHSSLVGREIVLTDLQTCWRALHTRRRKQLAVITGEAGVGKTRLVREWQQAQQTVPEAPAAWVYCRGRPYAQKTGGLFIDALEQIIGITEADAPKRRWSKVSAFLTTMFQHADPGWIETFNTKVAFLGHFLGLDFAQRKDGETFLQRWTQLEPQARQLETRLAIRDVLTHSAQTAPVFLILDDLHWADKESLDMIAFIWDKLEHRAPVLFCLMFRERKNAPVWQLWQDLRRVHPPNVEIALRELANEDHRQLVTNLLHPHQVSEDLRQLILDATDGNPLYVEEVLHTLIEEQTLLLHEGREWRLAPHITRIRVPVTLQQIIQSRIDELDFRSPGTRRVLWMAAVIGEQFDEALLLYLFTSTRHRESEEDLWQHLSVLRNVEMIEEFEDVTQARWGYRFRHGLVQNVAYENILIEKRREYHGVVGQWLEETYSAELPRHYAALAHHYRHSAMREKALYYLDKAARKAQHDYANEAALNFYTQALAIEERWEWRKGQVDVLHILGRREEEQAALRALAALHGAPAFEVAYLWGQYYEAISEYEQAQDYIERALEESRERNQRLAEARCLDRLGFIAWRQGACEQAITYYQQALRLLQVTAVDDEAQVLAQAINGLATVYRQQGAFEKAAAYYRQALKFNRDIGDRMGEARTLNNLGGVAFYERQFADAFIYYQQALALRQAIGDRSGEGECLNNLAMVARDSGDYGQAKEYFAAALAIQQTVGNRWEEVNVWNSMGIMYQELGELAEAQACLQKGLALAQDIGDEAGQTYILGSLGVVMRDLGELDTAETLLDKGLSLARAQMDKYLEALFLSHLGIVSLQAHRHRAAFDYAQAALEIWEDMRQLVLTTTAIATQAAVYLANKDSAHAVQRAQQALQILEECQGQGPECPERDYFVCHQVLKGTGHEHRARQALEAAYQLVAAQADGIADPELRQSFLEHVPINRKIVQAYESLSPTDKRL